MADSNDPEYFYDICTVTRIGHLCRESILYECLYGQKTRKHIKGLIPGKNKPWTEIWTPMRKMHFYRCIGQLAVHITLFGWCVLGGWRVDGVEV